MLTETDEVFLYNLTLSRQNNFNNSCIGHFLDYKPHHFARNNEKIKKRKKRNREFQLCVATETHIELYDLEDGLLNKLCTVPIFATLTAMEKLPIDGDCAFLSLVTDSGNLTICRFALNSGKIRLITFHNEPLGRSGLRRLAPQRGIVADQQGRCLLLSALERDKLCFQTQFVDGHLQLSSSLQLSEPELITLQTVCCDVSFDNPKFASLQINLIDKSRQLTFYVLDLGLNQLSRHREFTLPGDVNFLMPLPSLEKYSINTRGSGEGLIEDEEINPFVLLGFDNSISIRDCRGLYNTKVNLPRREGRNATTVIITGQVHTMKNEFLVLLQSDLGDLYKVKISPDNDHGNVPAVSIMYFDTIPAAQGLHILKNGYMFSNSELEQSYLFQFESLGNDSDPSKILTSKLPDAHLSFRASHCLENISIVDELRGLNPTLSGVPLEAVPFNLLVQNRYSKSALKSNVDFQELVSSPLPDNATNIWTIKLSTDLRHRLLFLAFFESVLILKIENGSLEELNNSDNVFVQQGDNTIYVGSMGHNSLIQVCENVMLQIVAENDGSYKRRLKWYPPAGIRIVKAACNASQLVLALSSNEIVYFELNQFEDIDVLSEYQRKAEFDEAVVTVHLAGGNRCNFLALGLEDSSLRILSLKRSDQESFLETISMQILLAPPNDVKMLEDNAGIFLHVGLSNGVYVCLQVDRLDGRLFHNRTKYLGSKPVEISLQGKVTLDRKRNALENGEDDEDLLNTELLGDSTTTCVVLRCNQSWASYWTDGMLIVRPLVSSIKGSIIKFAPFESEEITFNGSCCITTSGALIIGRLKDFPSTDEWFTSETIPNPGDERENRPNEFPNSAYRSRRVIVDKGHSKLAFLIDNHVTKNESRFSVHHSSKRYLSQDEKLPYAIMENSRCIDACVATFGNNKSYIVTTDAGKKIKCFEVELKKDDTQRYFKLTYLHDTPVDEVIHSIITFKDKVLVALGANLVLFGLGKKQLLKRSISPLPPSITKITSLSHWQGKRLAVGDAKESVMFFLFSESTSVFLPLADDTTKRHVTSIQFVDQVTVIGGDRFGNVWMLRLPREWSKIIDENLPYFMSKFYRGATGPSTTIQECPLKLELACHFFINDVPLSFSVIENLNMSGRAAVIYTGLQGTVGSLTPLVTMKEVEFYQKLEEGLRSVEDLSSEEGKADESELAGDADNFIDVAKNKSPLRPSVEGAFSIVGRDHLMYRSYYAPVRHVIDGDFCESFFSLFSDEQTALTQKIGFASTALVKDRIAEIRRSYL
ncbi:LAMI_0G03488g1_1 [Lachancea mirantina]|uniref:LAMI_0G03488g1_1 n=1 Tax=Lachancea mirantina TaxID=1230905 RepID=A0A1G4K897_9SACH|nr:LAMI_0G03488g1_1 [Lachancea mirantina]